MSQVDISSELYTIENSIYGSDMRQAIHDALEKLANSSGGGGLPLARDFVTVHTSSISGGIGNLEEVNE